MTEVVLYIPLVVVLVLLGGFFSGSETGVYRLSKFRLRLGTEQNKPFHSLLSGILADSQGLVFSILIGNNLVNYLSTSIVTLMLLAAGSSDQAAQAWATFMMTPLLFIFSEVLPKNIFYYRSDRLMPKLAAPLWFFDRLFRYSGLVWALKGVHKLFDSIFYVTGSETVSRHLSERTRLLGLFRESSEEGILSSIQNELIHRMVDMPSTNLQMVMVPAARMTAVDVKTNRAQLLKIIEQVPFTRLPVFENNLNSIMGYVNVYEALGTGEVFSDLRKHVKPISRLSADTTVIEAINIVRQRGDKIVLVIAAPGNRRRVMGLVTMKDLVEEVTGELAQW